MKKTNLMPIVGTILSYLIFITFYYIVYHDLNLYIHIIGFVYSGICFFLSVLVHEFAHASIAKILGYEVYSIYFIPFTLVKTKHWKITNISFTNKNVLGRVRFYLPPFHSLKDYKKVVRRFIIIEILGPLSNFICLFLFTILYYKSFISLPFLAVFYYIFGYIMVSTLVAGDGKVAYYLYKYKTYALHTIFYYYIYNKNYDRLTVSFLCDLMKQYLEQTENSKNSCRDSNRLSLHMDLLTSFFTRDITSLPDSTKQFIKTCVSEKDNLLENHKSRSLYVSFFHYLIMYFITIHDKEAAEIIYAFLKETVTDLNPYYELLNI